MFYARFKVLLKHIYKEFNTAFTNKICTYRTFLVLYDVYTENKIIKKTCEEIPPIFPMKQKWCIHKVYTVAHFNEGLTMM